MTRSIESHPQLGPAGYVEGPLRINPLLRSAALLYVCCTPLDVVPIPIGSPVTIAGVLFLFAWGIALVRGEVHVPRGHGLLLVLGALTVWSFATVAWSYVPSLSMTRSVSTLLLALSAVAISGVFPRSVEPPACALAIGAAIAGVAAIIGGPEIAVGSEQATFLGIDQNALGFHLSMGLASALFVILRVHGAWRRIGIGVVAAIHAGALIVVGSRTGIGSGLALAAVFGVLSMGSVRRTLNALGVLAIGLLMGRWIAMHDLVPSRVLDWLENPIATDSRTEIIAAYRWTQEEWVLRGVGAGADADYLFAGTSVYKNAHSAFWKVWIELGIVGLILWGLLLLGVAYRAWRSVDRHFFVLSAIPILLFFYTLGPLNSNALWVVFGLALGSASQASPNGAKESVPGKTRSSGDDRPGKSAAPLSDQGDIRPRQVWGAWNYSW